jgi:hypothetical protein
VPVAFRRDGRWTFLSFDDRARVLTLELDRTVPGVGFDVVVLGVDDPAGVAAKIEARAATPDHSSRPSQWVRTVSGAIRRITRSDMVADSS